MEGSSSKVSSVRIASNAQFHVHYLLLALLLKQEFYGIIPKKAPVEAIHAVGISTSSYLCSDDAQQVASKITC
jgi:hypothetical protein